MIRGWRIKFQSLLHFKDNLYVTDVQWHINEFGLFAIDTCKKFLMRNKQSNRTTVTYKLEWLEHFQRRQILWVSMGPWKVKVNGIQLLAFRALHAGTSRSCFPVSSVESRTQLTTPNDKLVKQVKKHNCNWQKVKNEKEKVKNGNAQHSVTICSQDLCHSLLCNAYPFSRVILKQNLFFVIKPTILNHAGLDLLPVLTVEISTDEHWSYHFWSSAGSTHICNFLLLHMTCFWGRYKIGMFQS